MDLNLVHCWTSSPLTRLCLSFSRSHQDSVYGVPNAAEPPEFSASPEQGITVHLFLRSHNLSHQLELATEKFPTRQPRSRLQCDSTSEGKWCRSAHKSHLMAITVLESSYPVSVTVQGPITPNKRARGKGLQRGKWDKLTGNQSTSHKRARGIRLKSMN